MGTPTVGAAVAANWTLPVIVGRFGDDGSPGVGYEYIFAVTNTSIIEQSKRPLNTWGYDAPGTVGSLTWHDAAPSVGSGIPHLWRSQRRVVGTPTVGAAIPDHWTAPTIISRYGEGDGRDGVDGDDGTSGVGYEFIFAATNTSLIEQSKRPLNTWGYDQPVAVDGLTWHDAAPGIGSTTPILWMSQRVVEGTPAVGEAVTALWRTPRIIGRYGQGDGQDGNDGAGIEYIFAATATESLDTNQRPLNNWSYDRPSIVNGVRWHDASPGISALKPILWSAQRRTEGYLAPGRSGAVHLDRANHRGAVRAR